MSSIKEAKQQATRLLTRLNELGVAIKHAQALEGVAAIFNHSDWNRYSALLKTQENSVSDVTEKSDENENFSIPTLADTPITFLAMSPGYGKSTILYHCLADALYQPSATGVYIDCSGHRATGIPYEIPRNIACHCSLIQLRVTDDGELQTITESLDLSKESLKRIVIYSIDFGGLGVGRNNLANSNALFSLVYDHILKLPQAFLSELRYVLIDEFDRIGFKASQRGLTSLYDRLPNRKIVVSSQTLPVVMDLDFMPSAPFSFISNTKSVNAFATRFSELQLDQMAQPYRNLSIYNADTFDQTIDLSDTGTFVKSIATFTSYNLQRNRLAQLPQSYELPVTNNAQLAYFEDCTKEIVERAISRMSAKNMGFAV